MAPVFAHGRLRLYLLKLLDEAPRHGYEVIRLLEERFQGLYAPSAGTVYPRLAKLEAEGLVTHTTEGGRKVYSITDAGREELAGRSGELADLELEIRESVAELAAEIRDDVKGAAGDLRREMRAAASEARQEPGGHGGRRSAGGRGDFTGGDPGGFGDREAWRNAREELRRLRQEWKDQARRAKDESRRAKDESRRARDEAQRARRQAREAQEWARNQAQREFERVAEQVKDRVAAHFARGDWPTGVREGMAELAKEFGDLSSLGHFGKGGGPGDFAAFGGFAVDDVDDRESDAGDTGDGGGSGTGPGRGAPGPWDKVPADALRDAAAEGHEPEWAHGDFGDSTGEPARDLDRLLDRFRDDIRDVARDNGVDEAQLRAARRHLSTAAARIAALLSTPRAGGGG
ncbi:helix-turn-helix transcriptional regulator [Streptomyces sp. NPDC050560]|uniref:PadR family transcriptional regulator n=1 Tax=Streptomyces sp. NPDC050560 TaxID=3365630 RepID=UPI0037A6790C